MSLTSLLKSKEAKDLRSRFSTLRKHLTVNAPEGVTWGSKPLVKSARPGDVYYASLIGTAFDYWLRLWLLQRHHSGAEDKLVARIAFAYAESSIKFTCKNIKKAWQNACYIERRLEEVEKRRKILGKNEKELLTPQIFRDCVFLASLDPLYRAPITLDMWKNPETDDNLLRDAIHELKDMATLALSVPERFGPSSLPLWPNPTFGEGSHLVGGADADMVIGDTLWEIKSKAKFTFDGFTWAQLAGYWVLSQISSVPFKIENFAVYLSRFGASLHLSLDALNSKVDLEKYKNDLIKLARKLY